MMNTTKKLESDIDRAVRICAHADQGGPAHLLREGEVCDRDWRCWACHASAAEVRERGHRRVDLDGLFDRACPEACTCIPQHKSIAEHLAEVGHYSDPPIR